MSKLPLAENRSLTPTGRVSAWVRRWSHLVAPGATVLDVACGAGRHVRWFAERGHAVTAVDRDATVLEPLRGVATVVVADIEAAAWPLPGQRFGAVVVTNYLWRPLWPSLLHSVAQGGVLLHETFSVGQASIGKPSNPDFLLKPGELLQAVGGLRIVAYEDGFGDDATDGGDGSHPAARFVQRIVAVREPGAAGLRIDASGPSTPAGAAPPRYPLDSGRRPVEKPVAGG